VAISSQIHAKRHLNVAKHLFYNVSAKLIYTLSILFFVNPKVRQAHDPSFILYLPFFLSTYFRT
jgi:hypothetical protein